jgi:6-pyruvoyltetrahydropterin/6-carboxytetrahydropterin synthase
LEIFQEFRFEAAHRLPNVPLSHPCAGVHGHSFTLTVYLRGATQPDSGWVMDFGDLARGVMPIIDALDHHYLNEVSGLTNPTTEGIARWIWGRLVDVLPGLCRIILRETAFSGCVYEGEGV